ncbi:L,D-transpeptidase family protein [Modicisalibacter coralii]|uniref:L,D-transpeptidase family protein n=1 Tax=Modicisalibacter coralii TaxID=2304602 RepID=UPI00100ADD36|nr:L,D-transpeptidase [Halomonas coralii]
MRRILCTWILGLLLAMPALAQAVTEREAVWVLVDHASSTLTIYRGDRELERFHPISVGRRGVASQRLRGDMTTPSGEFRITRINRDSNFHIFLGLDYPNLAQARQAQEDGTFSDSDFARYLSYYRRHGRPPQDTILGGSIGIHGLGEADPELHRRFNWTQGCVAVTNRQIDRLTQLVRLGTKVIIR